MFLHESVEMMLSEIVLLILNTFKFLWFLKIYTNILLYIHCQKTSIYIDILCLHFERQNINKVYLYIWKFSDSVYKRNISENMYKYVFFYISHNIIL